jgi:hypothetical protein
MAAPAQRRLLGHDADEQARGITDLPAAPRPPAGLERSDDGIALGEFHDALAI